jgi:hypothetical protein
METKICSKCQQEKSVSEFSRRKFSSGRVGYKSHCKQCLNAANSIRYADPKEREKRRVIMRAYVKKDYVKHAHRKTMLMRTFGLSLDQYDSIYTKQVGLCPICRLPLPDGYAAAVDHDHHTGKVRGLLHTACNSALGFLNDDIQRLRNAVDYLEEMS